MKAKLNPKPFEYLEWSAKFLKFGYRLSVLPYLGYWILRLSRPLYVDRETFFNRKFRFAFLILGGGILPPEEIRPYRLGAKAFVDNMENVIKAEQSGKPVVWVEWILSSEIVNAFDAIPFNPETLSVFGNLSGKDVPSRLMEEAENRGFATENCSAIKVTAGAYMLRQSPQPSAIIAGSHPCDTNVAAYQSIAHLTGAPVFFF